MDEAQWTLVDIIGPAIILGLLIWLAIRWGRRKPGTPLDERSEQGTRNVYREEETRRREGTDGL